MATLHESTGESMKRDLTPYEHTVVNFLAEQKGSVIAVTDDGSFLTVLHQVFDNIGIPAQDSLMSLNDSVMVLKAIKDADAKGQVPFVFMERKLKGQDMGFMVKLFKTAFPNALLIILTPDAEKSRIIYLHELGADNFIAKPVSTQTVVEKMAFTIKPQSDLGKYIDEAKDLLQNNKPAEAKILAIKILEIKPGSSAGLMILGDSENALGNYGSAQKAYLAASESAKLFLEPLRKLAELAEKTGDLRGCLSYLERLDTLSPLNPDRKVNMGQINLTLGHEDKALKLFDSAMEQVTREALDRIGALAERVASIYASKNPTMSEMFLRKALDVKRRYLSRDDLRIFNQLGISLRRQGKWQEAIEEYKKALLIAPDDPTLHYNIAMAHAEGDKLEEALTFVTKALSFQETLTRTSAAVAFNIGHIFMKNGLYDKARPCFETALSLNPAMQSALAGLRKLDDLAVADQEEAGPATENIAGHGPGYSPT